MKRYEVPLQENGRMILPAELRQALGVGKGDRIVIEARGDRIELTTTRRSRDLARERVRRRFPDAQGVVDEFLAERRAEAEREGDAAPPGAPRVEAGTGEASDPDAEGPRG
jgi:AbrB family looped-hinge helix DNA binding protein